jgi:2-polyprenyl-6-methoxyphenol hydroxylase-like FAD-dependent oxidoreductase
MANERIHDVLQIGYGPVGQTSAAMLGRYGHDVAVFERHAGLYALPRAGHIDHEIVRAFQSIGAADAIMEDAFRCQTYGWRNQHGETLLDIDWSQEGVSGWASDYLMYQPYVEDALDRAVRAQPRVEVHHGWEAVELATGDDLVTVTFARGQLDDGGVYRHSGERRTVRGRYLIGADGANSFTRDSAGLELEDLGFREQWLVVDFRQTRPISFAFDNGQICDPARPLCLFQLGKTHRRFEFMVLPGEDPAALARPESIWPLVAGWIGPDDAELIRSTVYTFRSANARQWRAGRVLIAGDAAHLMPPFLGQGMCSGVRDVANLSWKLDLVLRGIADDSLLDSYMLERKPHVGSIIEQAVALGRVSCTIDPDEARARDAAFLSGDIPPPPPFPWIMEGVVDDASPKVAGKLGPQGRVTVGGVTGLADDIVGLGWQLICRDDAIHQLDEDDRALLSRLDVRIIALDAPDGISDVDQRYADFLDDAGTDAILVRPDFYIFGATDPSNLLSALLRTLADKLQLR